MVSRPGVSCVLRGEPVGSCAANRASLRALSSKSSTAALIACTEIPRLWAGEIHPALITEPLVAGSPDLRGVWKAVSATRGGEPVPAGDRLLAYTERIEQCGNRIVDCGGGTIADARADGTEENGVHDVSAFDYVTPIHVVASYEDGAFVLRPVGLPGFEVRRELDADGHMVWTRPDMGDIRVVLERVGGVV